MMLPEASASTVPTALSKSTPTATASPNASTPRKDDKRSVDSQSRSGERADHSGVRLGQLASQLGRSSPNVLPRNPRDTAVPFSPKRRVKGLSGAASLGGSMGNVHGVNVSMAGSVGSAHRRSHSDALEPDNTNSNNNNNNAHVTGHATNLLPSGRPTTPSNSAMLHPHAAIPLVHSLSSPLSCSTPNSIHDTPGSTQTTSPTHVTLDSDEQFMFEQRLTHDELGVAIRKINQSGKAQLRYVKCVPLRPPSSSDYGPKDGPMMLPYYLEDRSYRGDVSVSSRSTSSSRFLERIRSGMFEKSAPVKTPKSALSSMDDQDAGDNNLLLKEETNLRALTWGKKNTVTIPLSHFVAVRKGKTTERTIRNTSPSGRLLSIVTKSGRGCLDIEAPTRLDRDKFASAFSVFLGVPLEDERTLELRSVGEGGSVAKKKLKTPSITRPIKKKQSSAAQSEPGLLSTSSTPKVRNRSVTAPEENVSILPALTPSSDKASDIDKELTFFNETKQTINDAKKNPAATPGTSSMGDTMSASARKRILSVDTKSESMLDPPKKDAQDANADKKKKSDEDDDASHVSSLTGAVDQEIVEELHQAIIELRAELDASRAEAARAVKVAEQAIQSAENCSSSDWNSTVTHKAAEAAALAQKKSAEAIARARMAEERLSAERKSTAFWRRQAQAAEEEAGSLKTRSAAAELQQSIMVEELASEKRRAARMFASLKEEFGRGEERQAKELQSARERRRDLEVEVDRLKGELGRKDEEMRRIHEERERCVIFVFLIV
ncbi:hypothetical protein ACHAWX_006771 [Stephanocyclus meneghinianus]